MPSKIDRNAHDHDAHRRNWQRLEQGAFVFTIPPGSITSGFLADNSVTFAKMQNIPTDTLLGRDTPGTGDPESITVGGGIAFTGTGGIQTSAFTGDVTKALGGTALTIANDAVTFAKFQNITDNRLLGRSAGSAGDMMEIVIGSGLSLSGGTLSNTATFTSPLTTKGDIFVFSTADDRLPVGINRKVLLADSSTATGLAWRTVTSLSSASFTNSGISNTTTKTILLISLTLTAAEVTSVVASGNNAVVAGLNWFGDVSCANAGDTLTLTLDVTGGTAGGTTTAMQTVVLTMAGTETNVPLMIDAAAAWSVAGAAGKARGSLRVMRGTTAVVTLSLPTADTTIDTTGTVNNFRLHAQWSVARVTNVLTRRGNYATLFATGLGF